MAHPTGKEFKHFDHAMNKATGWKPSHAAAKINATANLLKEQRLNQQADHLHDIGMATERAESKLPMTADSLSKLGAGSEFGT